MDHQVYSPASQGTIGYHPTLLVALVVSHTVSSSNLVADNGYWVSVITYATILLLPIIGRALFLDTHADYGPERAQRSAITRLPRAP